MGNIVLLLFSRGGSVGQNAGGVCFSAQLGHVAIINGIKYFFINSIGVLRFYVTERGK